MGYQASSIDTSAPAKIELRSVSARNFELMTPFAYVSRTGQVVAVPRHPNEFALSTDLASVPPLLWGLLPSYGRQLRAALVHDRLCDLVNNAPDRQQAYRDRRRADDLFLEALRDPGDGSVAHLARRVGGFRSRLFWVGVSYGRYWKFRKLLAALLTVHVLGGVLAADLIVRAQPLRWLAGLLPWGILADNATLALSWLAALVLSFTWRRDWPIPFIGVLVGPLILPVLLVTFIAQVGLGLPDWVAHRIRPAEQPPADFGPTVTAMESAP